MRSSQSYGYIQTLCCRWMKPIDRSVYRILFLTCFRYSGISNMSTRHLRSHRRGFRIAISRASSVCKAVTPFDVRRSLRFSHLRRPDLTRRSHERVTISFCLGERMMPSFAIAPKTFGAITNTLTSPASLTVSRIILLSSFLRVRRKLSVSIFPMYQYYATASVWYRWHWG